MENGYGTVAAAELASLLANLCATDGSHRTAIEGLFLTRFSTTKTPRSSLSSAVFCVVAQGAKSAQQNGQRFLYDASKYLLVPLDLPLTGQIEEASQKRPFLGLSLVLDFDELSVVVQEAGLGKPAPSAADPGLIVQDMDEELLDAVTRLVRLLRTPTMVPMLAPLVRKEIYFRLLMSSQRSLLLRVLAEHGKTRRIAAGLDWLRRNAARTFRMEELARELHMSPSTMHSWFREVTAMSPLQFQKQLRLQEARRLMLSEGVDANAAGRRVGYESASQFTREYKRFYGAPPMRDVEALRAGMVT